MSKATGPKKANSESKTLTLSASVPSPAPRTMTDPVCRSPWMSASAHVMNQYLARPMASTNTVSALRAAASASLAGSTAFRPASTDGSVKTRSSVIVQSSGLIAEAWESASCWRSSAKRDVPNATAPM